MLWQPGTIQLLTSKNTVVAGVWPGSAAAALDLVGQGEAVAVMGRLRPGVRAVDIDLDDPDATTARDAVLAWAHARGHATICRPSGKPGHVHVLIAGLPPTDTTLDQACITIRADLGGLPFAAVDPRRSRTLRTLTSPHRHGLPCPPPTGDIAAFTRALDRLDPAPPANTRKQRTSKTAGTRPTRTHTRAAEVLIPRPRPHRPLPEHITQWLTTGQPWTITGGTDHSNSTREAIATASMVRAGWTHQQAWTAILTAHPQAMTRARANPRRWDTCVWNRAVTDNEHHGTRTPVDGDIAAALTAARTRLDNAAKLRLTPRARRAVLLVADAVLHMMAAKNTRRVSVAQRTLHEDLGLSRPVIGRALTWLHDAGVIVLDRDVLDRRLTHRATTSYEATLPESIQDVTHEGVRESSPPCCHTPPAPELPPASNQLLRTLALGPLAPTELAVAALLTAGPHPSPSELRTTLAALRTLATTGHVTVDIHGVWHLSPTGPTTEHTQTAARARYERTARIEAERAAYRTAASSDWSIARAAAIKTQRAKEKAWWNSLTRDERTERQAHHAMRYAELPLAEQVRVRDYLTRRRAAAGIDETAYGRAWADTFTQTQWADRTAMRAAIHRSLPQPERAAQVAAWEHHRARWRIPRIQPTTHEPTAALPDTARDRDDAFILQQLVLIETTTTAMTS